MTGLATTARNEQAAQSALSRHAAPPVKKQALLWSVLAMVSGPVAVAALFTGGAGTVLVAIVAVLAAVFAFRAARYNTSAYPELRRLWERSFMCASCGDVFAD